MDYSSTAADMAEDGEVDNLFGKSKEECTSSKEAPLLLCLGRINDNGLKEPTVESKGSLQP